jgi:hypothetical protein
MHVHIHSHTSMYAFIVGDLDKLKYVRSLEEKIRSLGVRAHHNHGADKRAVTQVYVYMYTYMNIYLHVVMYIYIYIHICIYIHVYIFMCIYRYMHIITTGRTNGPSPRYLYIYIYIYVYIFVYIYIYV